MKTSAGTDAAAVPVEEKKSATASDLVEEGSRAVGAVAGVAAARDAADVALVADRKGKKAMVDRDLSVADLEKGDAGSDASGMKLTGVAAVDKPEAGASDGDLQKGGAGGNEEAEDASTDARKRKQVEYVHEEDVSTYDYGSDVDYEGEESADSDEGGMDIDNLKSYVRHLLKKPKTHVIRKGWKFVCPLCPTKPKKGLKADLVQHVTKLAYESDDYRIKGQHITVMQVLFPNGEA